MQHAAAVCILCKVPPPYIASICHRDTEGCAQHKLPPHNKLCCCNECITPRECHAGAQERTSPRVLRVCEVRVVHERPML